MTVADNDEINRQLRRRVRRSDRRYWSEADWDAELTELRAEPTAASSVPDFDGGPRTPPPSAPLDFNAVLRQRRQDIRDLKHGVHPDGQSSTPPDAA